MKIIVSQPCQISDCDCKQYDGADPAEVGMPPFHEGCTCYVVFEATVQGVKPEAKVVDVTKR